MGSCLTPWISHSVSLWAVKCYEPQCLVFERMKTVNLMFDVVCSVWTLLFVHDWNEQILKLIASDHSQAQMSGELMRTPSRGGVITKHGETRPRQVVIKACFSVIYWNYLQMFCFLTCLLTTAQRDWKHLMDHQSIQWLLLAVIRGLLHLPSFTVDAKRFHTCP